LRKKNGEGMGLVRYSSDVGKVCGGFDDRVHGGVMHGAGR